MAEQLTPLDAIFLEVEDSDRHVSLAIGCLAVVAGPMPDFDELVKSLEPRVRAIPRCLHVLRTHSLDLQAPEWVDDTAFDIRHHIRHAALPNPGDEHSLFELVAEVMERRLDRSRPMWECVVIEGLSDDRWALLIKVHHSLADGIAATNLITSFSDDNSAETFATDLSGTTAARPRRSSWRLPSLNPAKWAIDSWRLSMGMARTAAQVATGTVQIATSIARPAAASPLTGPVSDLRRYSGAHVSLDEIRRISRTFDVTLNDVVLAAVTDSYREALLRRGLAPDPASLRTLVPVSIRSADQLHRSDNRVTLMLPRLPVEEPDPIQRLRQVHERMTRAKGGGEREAGNIIWATARRLPFAWSAWAVRFLIAVPQRGVVTVVTNVPGPRNKLSFMGREVQRVLPIPPIAVGFRTGVAILSYADSLEFGIIADYDTVPDIDEFARGIERGVAHLAAGHGHGSGRSPSTMA